MFTNVTNLAAISLCYQVLNLFFVQLWVVIHIFRTGVTSMYIAIFLDLFNEK